MKKLHPSSIAYRSLSRSLNTGFLFFVIGVIASPGGGGANLALIASMVLVGIAVGVVYEVAYYERFRYELTQDTFDVTSGVLSRRNREVPLRRVQNVDVRQNVLQRALGIAAIHVETAGGGQTEVTLQYVTAEEARSLQRRLRHGNTADEERTDRERTGESVTTDGVDRETSGEERDEAVLFEIRRNELAILSLFTIDPGASLLGGIALSFASGFDPMTLVPFDFLERALEGTGVLVIAWAVLLFLIAAWLLSAALTFTRYYGFTLTRVGDELHYERGLLQRYSGTIPLDKVQTLTITESVPYRWFGYASLAVETAGYAPGQSGGRGSESAIPLAERDRVFPLGQSIESFSSIDHEPLPSRARERYAVRYVGLVGLVLGVSYVVASWTGLVQDWYVPAVFFGLVPVAAHLKWTKRGYRAGDRYFVARTGFWRQTTKVVPYYRVQTVVHSQTIFQRRRTLASVTADTASSASLLGRAATAHDVDADRGLELQRTIERRLQERLRERKRHRSIGEWFETETATDEPAVDG